jgi:hypothetical protein
MRALTTVALFLAAVVTAGCGGGKKEEAGNVVVKGRLTKGGNPYILDESEIKMPKGTHGLPPGVAGANSALSITFYSMDSKGSYTAKTNASAGTFEVTGDTGSGIPAGRYKVSVTAKLGTSPDTPDVFNGRYTFEKTKIIKDVRAGEDVVIDITKDAG